MKNSNPHPDARDRPCTVEGVEASYIGIRARHQHKHDYFAERKSWTGWALILCLVVIVMLAVHSGRQTSAWPLLVSFTTVFALIAVHLALQSKMARMARLLCLYDQSLARIRAGNWQSGNAGNNLRKPRHLYERDLNLFGESSLFGRLDTVRTGIGQRSLADYLQFPVSHAEALSRQEAVKEIVGRTQLREEISLLGTTKFQQVEASAFDTWLEQELPPFHPLTRSLLTLTAFSLVVMLVLGLTHSASWGTLLPNLALAGAVQTTVCLYLRRRVRPVLERAAKLSNHIQLLSDGLALLQRQTLVSEKLRSIQTMANEPADAVSLLAALQGQITIVQQRTKEYFFAFSILLAAGTQAAIALTSWKRKHATAMRQWLSAWGEFDALNGIALYAFENPLSAWPELLPAAQASQLNATELKHPLVNECVSNDIDLGGPTKFYLISGSNMSGKSTLMRSIGINAVLAYAGAPVKAKAMRLTPLTLGASLALTDSLAEGKSKFLAEVERLQEIVRSSAGGPTLFLVDEIFSGTNSADRQAAAGAVLEKLLLNQAIGALSTHDLALTELATERKGGLNVHMASPDPEDPLGFDYKLKEGINTSSNALAIIRMMDLEARGERQNVS